LFLIVVEDSMCLFACHRFACGHLTPEYQRQEDCGNTLAMYHLREYTTLVLAFNCLNCIEMLSFIPEWERDTSRRRPSEIITDWRAIDEALGWNLH